MEETKIERIKELCRERIKVYEDFMEKNIFPKKMEELTSLEWSLLNGYSSEKELCEMILTIIEGS